MSDCQEPEKCTCRRKIQNDFITGEIRGKLFYDMLTHLSFLAPFYFAKMHGCIPHRCYCKGKQGSMLAIRPYEYLKVMAREVGMLTKQRVKMVMWLKQPRK